MAQWQPTCCPRLLPPLPPLAATDLPGWHSLAYRLGSKAGSRLRLGAILIKHPPEEGSGKGGVLLSIVHRPDMTLAALGPNAWPHKQRRLEGAGAAPPLGVPAIDTSPRWGAAAWRRAWAGRAAAFSFRVCLPPAARHLPHPLLSMCFCSALLRGREPLMKAQLTRLADGDLLGEQHDVGINGHTPAVPPPCLLSW